MVTGDLIDRANEGDSTGEFATAATNQPARVRVEFGAVTHPGRVRATNEDQFLIARLSKSLRVLDTSVPGADRYRYSDEEGYLMVVADGMGGAAAGEEASAQAVRTIEAFVLNTLKWFLHLGRQEENVLMGELRAALERADRDVIERAWSDPALAGMGTTLTLGYSVGTDLYIVHAGDSRAYLLRGGELEQITHDHTLVQLLVDGGTLTPEDAKRHSRRNVVTNVVGGPREGVHAEISKLRVADGDLLLLCSDGLSEPVEDPEIADVLSHSTDPKDACARLLDLALDRGGPDNISIVVARYHVD